MKFRSIYYYVPFIIIGLILILFLTYYRFKEPMLTNTNNTILENIDIIYYINLDHRTDRKDQFLIEMKKLQIPDDKIVRISAIHLPERGDLGCSMSHIKTMELFTQSSHKNCIIFEDDFEFTRDPTEITSTLQSFFDNKIEYDVCMLSSNEIQLEDTSHAFLKKVISTQTASGYMVNRSFADTLLMNFREGAMRLRQGYDIGNPNGQENCVDQYWKRLQPSNRWYMFYPKFGKQRKSHSDIQGGMIDSQV